MPSPELMPPWMQLFAQLGSATSSNARINPAARPLRALAEAPTSRM
jgi:hypothetical protein